MVEKDYWRNAGDKRAIRTDLEITSSVELNVYLRDSQHFVLAVDPFTGFDTQHVIAYCFDDDVIIIKSRGFSREFVVKDASSGKFVCNLRELMTEDEFKKSCYKPKALKALKSEEVPVCAFEQLDVIGVYDDIADLVEILEDTKRRFGDRAYAARAIAKICTREGLTGRRYRDIAYSMLSGWNPLMAIAEEAVEIFDKIVVE